MHFAEIEAQHASVFQYYASDSLVSSEGGADNTMPATALSVQKGADNIIPPGVPPIFVVYCVHYGRIKPPDSNGGPRTNHELCHQP
jgi:hypothetical protein